MTEIQYPKVLIVGWSFNAVSAGGITLTNLFKDWPKDKVAVATDKYAAMLSGGELGVPYYIFEAGKAGFLSGLKNRVKRFVPNRLKRAVKIFIAGLRAVCLAPKRLLVLFGFGPLLEKADLTKDFLRSVKDFDPAVIYTISFTIKNLRQVLLVASAVQKPIVMHITDDELYYYKNLGSYFTRILYKRYLLKLINKASVHLTVSEKMCREYASRYNKKFVAFCNPVDLDKWLPFAKTDYKIYDTMRVLYAGRIGGGTNASLCAIAEAIDLLADEGYKIEFHIFSAHKILARRKGNGGGKCVKFHPLMPYEECPKMFATFDVLVLANDFDQDSRQFALFSLSTKTSEYMITGVPILVHTPPDFALSEYAREKGWAYVVNENDITKLKNAIRILYSDANLRERLGKTARTVAVKEHDAKSVREKFRQELCRAVM